MGIENRIQDDPFIRAVTKNPKNAKEQIKSVALNHKRTPTLEDYTFFQEQIGLASHAANYLKGLKIKLDTKTKKYLKYLDNKVFT